MQLNKNTSKIKIFHDDMYDSRYWKDNKHQAYESFNSLVDEFIEEDNRDKLKNSCEVLMSQKYKFCTLSPLSRKSKDSRNNYRHKQSKTLMI